MSLVVPLGQQRIEIGLARARVDPNAVAVELAGDRLGRGAAKARSSRRWPASASRTG